MAFIFHFLVFCFFSSFVRFLFLSLFFHTPFFSPLFLPLFLSLHSPHLNCSSKNSSQVLALVWGLMMKYMRFDDDEDESKAGLSAKDALLKWLQFHTSAYKSVSVQNLTKSFHSGLAFVALIHKFKPELVPNPDSLSEANALANIKLAMDAAEKWLGLEQYIQPKDIAKLDEKSALVYVR